MKVLIQQVVIYCLEKPLRLGNMIEMYKIQICFYNL